MKVFFSQLKAMQRKGKTVFKMRVELPSRRRRMGRGLRKGPRLSDPMRST